MRCEAVDTEEKYQSTAPEIGVSKNMPVQFLLPHGDEAATLVEQVAHNRYATWGCHTSCIDLHSPPVPYHLYQP